MLKKFLPILIIFVVAAPAAAQMKMEIFPLKSRTVEEMIPVIQPLLGGQGTVTGMQGNLIVRSTPGNLATVREVLKKLDSALRNLRITVRQGLRRDLDTLDAEVSADVRVGESGRVIIGSKPTGRDGFIIGGSSGNSQVRAGINRNLSRQDRMDTQQVVTLEGRPATIYVTRLLPFKEVRTVTVRGKTIRREFVVLREVPAGITVLPRTQGDRVILQVDSVASSHGPGGIETQGIHTTISGRLGEWIELGGLSRDENLAGRQIFGASRSQGREKRSVFLKVEPMLSQGTEK